MAKCMQSAALSPLTRGGYWVRPDLPGHVPLAGCVCPQNRWHSILTTLNHCTLSGTADGAERERPLQEARDVMNSWWNQCRSTDCTKNQGTAACRQVTQAARWPKLGKSGTKKLARHCVII